MWRKQSQPRASNTITHTPMTAPQTNSNGENVPDIQALGLKVQELSGSVDWWNNAIIISLVFAALAAVAVGLSTYVAFKKAAGLAKAQGRLAEAKDYQVQVDLKNKDVEIAVANERAAKAQEGAAKANLELERIKTPRTISTQDQSEIIVALKPFAGTPYDLSVAADSESVAFLKIIHSVLSSAGWTQVAAKGPIGISNSNPLIGITLNVGIFIELDAGKFPLWGAATDKLVGLLKAKTITAQGNAALTGVDPNAVHIMVGKKP